MIERRSVPNGIKPIQRVGWVVLPAFGFAASFARSACQAAYSGVPGRGGVPGGSPPIQCGMSATGLLPVLAQPETVMQIAHRIRNVQIIVGSLKARCRRRLLVPQPSTLPQGGELLF